MCCMWPHYTGEETTKWGAEDYWGTYKDAWACFHALYPLKGVWAAPCNTDSLGGGGGGARVPSAPCFLLPCYKYCLHPNICHDFKAFDHDITMMHFHRSL